MNIRHKSRTAKILLLCLTLSVVDKGWVTKTHSFEFGALAITQEALYALTLGCSMLWRACTNSGNSAVDRVLQEEITRLRSSSNTQPTNKQNSSTRVEVTTGYGETSPAWQASTGKPIAQRISPTAVQKTEHIADKACAVVAHVAHEQIVQAAYTAIAQETKEASQELARQITLDWHVQNCQEALHSARTSAYNHLFEQLRAVTPSWTSEQQDNGGTKYYAPNRNFYFYVGPSRHNNSHPVADRIMRQRYELMYIHHNPELYHQVASIIDAFTNTCQQLVYGSLLERMTALLHLSDFYISGDTYGRELEEAQKALYAVYCHKDGSICLQALKNMSVAKEIMLRYCGLGHAHRSAFAQPVLNQNTQRCKHLFKKARKVSLRSIRRDLTNHCCKQMLLAFTSGDMQQVEHIKNEHAELADLAVLYEALKAEYEKALEQQEALLKDHDGILHFNLPVARRDPFYCALCESERVQLQTNPDALHSFNDALLIRNRYKQALHKAWNIPLSADAVVHQALYALIDCGTIPGRIEKIHAVATNPNITAGERKKIVDALFLPNGIVKDFAEYHRAKSLKMPAKILEEKYAEVRQLLNHLVYTEHVCNDEHIKTECAVAIEYIQAALAADDQESADECFERAKTLFDRIQNPLLDREPVGTCGTGKQKDFPPYSGECLPGIGAIQPNAPCCPPDQDKDGIKTESIYEPGRDPHKIPEPQPCGFSGQSLPSFGSDAVPIAEIDIPESDGTEPDVSDSDKEEDVSLEDAPAESNTSNGVKPIENPNVQVVDNFANQEIKTVEELINESEKIDDRPGMRFSAEYKRPGEYADAVKDFESLNPDKVRDLPRGKSGKHGILPDGRDVIVRLESSKDNYPTLEIQHKPHRHKIKFRYMGKNYSND